MERSEEGSALRGGKMFMVSASSIISYCCREIILAISQIYRGLLINLKKLHVKGIFKQSVQQSATHLVINSILSRPNAAFLWVLTVSLVKKTSFYKQTQ